MISPKKYAKAAKVLPKGFKTANEFFNYVYNDPDMIWMGQNTNHLHDHNGIVEAMIASIRWNDYCKYPPPEGFPRLRELIMEDLGLGSEYDILNCWSHPESLYLCTNDILEPETTPSRDPISYWQFCKPFGTMLNQFPYNGNVAINSPQLVR